MKSKTPIITDAEEMKAGVGVYGSALYIINMSVKVAESSMRLTTLRAGRGLRLEAKWVAQWALTMNPAEALDG